MANRKLFALISRNAKRHEVAMARRFLPELRAQVAAVAARLAAGQSASQAVAALDPRGLDKLKRQWALSYAVDAYNLTGGLLGKSSHGLDWEAKAAAGGPAPGAEFGADQLVAVQLRPRVDDWVNLTSKLETEHTANRFERMIKQAMVGWTDPATGEPRSATPRDLSIWFEDEGLAWSRPRADLMARTLTNWAYNDGAQALYRDEGFTLNAWLTTDDDVTCEACMAMDGTEVRIGERFAAAGDQVADQTIGLDVAHPPLHPHCRCALLPVVGS